MDGGTATGAFADRGLFLPEQILFASSIVGMIAWWSDTFLLSNTFTTSGVKSAPAIKGSFSQSSAIMPAAVPPMSSVRKLLSVLG